MRAFPIVMAVAAGLILTGCAQVPPGVNPSQSASSSSPVSSPSASWLSEEPIRLAVGEAADLSRTRGLPKAIIRIDNITEQASCPTGAATPQQGQFIAVELTGYRVGATGQFGLAVYDWLTVDAAGAEHDGKATVNSGLCLEAGSGLTLAYDGDGKVSGTVLIDAPSDVSLIAIRNNLADPPVTISIELPPR